MKRSSRTAKVPDALPDEVLAYLYSSLIFLLRRADQRAVSLFNEAARDVGLTLPQFHLLYIASEIGALPQGELARQVAASEATASTTISNLIERGLLTRSSDKADGRRKLIAATDGGRAMIAATLPAFRTALKQLEAPLGEQSGKLAGLLHALIERAGGAIGMPGDLSEAAAQRLDMAHHSIHFLVRRTVQIVEAVTGRHLVSARITLRQYVVLLIITLGPGIGESRIASTIGLDLSNTSFIARGLRKKGLVAVDESSRRRRYTATALGREILARIEPPLVQAVGECLELLDPGDRQPLLRLLGDVVAGGGGASAPPAFARISQSSGWPTAQRPSRFDQILGGVVMAQDNTLRPLLAQAAELLSASPEAVARLSPADSEQLRRLLTDLLEARRRPEEAAG